LIAVKAVEERRAEVARWVAKRSPKKKVGPGLGLISPTLP